MQGINHIHFIGIGGSGMSPLARIFLELGFQVTGSDLTASEVTASLIKKGARICIGHREENVLGSDIVVASVAIPETNVELICARSQGIPVLQRIEVLAMLMESRYGIAVSGAHGKTTTTSMIAMALEGGGLDPTVIIGGELNDIGGSAKLGRSEYLVAEADESSGQFLKLSPQVAVVTNIDAEHLEHYKSLDGVKEAFRQFLGRLKGEGFAVVCADDPNVLEVIEDHPGKVITYGLNPGAQVQAVDMERRGFSSQATVTIDGAPWLEMELNVPGMHNICNALAAVAIAKELGLEPDTLQRTLSSFRGVHRRFEVVGRRGGITIIDDYAHHPTELETTLRSARDMKTGRVIAVFQPHRYTRTKFLRSEFTKAFRGADMVIITDIYSAGETQIPGVTAEGLARDIAAQEGSHVMYIPHMDDIVHELGNILRPGDLVMTLGAGNIRLVGERLLDVLGG